MLDSIFSLLLVFIYLLSYQLKKIENKFVFFSEIRQYVSTTFYLHTFYFTVLSTDSLWLSYLHHI